MNLWILVVPFSLALGVWIGRRFRTAPGVPPSRVPAGQDEREAPPVSEFALPPTTGESPMPSTLGRIAHELRSPLGALASSLEIQERTLARQEVDPESPGFRASTRALATARAALGQIEQIAGSLRTAGRIRTEQTSLTPARALVDAALLLVAHRLHGGRIEREDQSGVQVRAVPGQIVRVLINLFVNADRAAGESGRIRVTTRERNGFVEFLVSDTGPGIPQGDEERIFLEGHTHWASGEAGEGYGLAVCRDVAHGHDGDLVLAPSEIGGATFLLRLPGGGEPAP